MLFLHTPLMRINGNIQLVFFKGGGRGVRRGRRRTWSWRRRKERGRREREKETMGWQSCRRRGVRG
jgi:hypothetical protein